MKKQFFSASLLTLCGYILIVPSFAQSDTETIKQKRIQELRTSIERDFALISGKTTAQAKIIKGSNFEDNQGQASVLVARINAEGKWETACLADSTAAANFLAGNTPSVNLKALKEEAK